MNMLLVTLLKFNTAKHIFKKLIPLKKTILLIPDRRMSKDSNAGDLKSAGNLILRWHGIGPLTPQQEQELQKMNDSVVRRFNESVMEKMTGAYLLFSTLSKGRF